MLNSFSTTQSQRELKFLFKFASIVFKSGPVNHHMEEDHSQWNWTRHLHIIEKLEGR